MNPPSLTATARPGLELAQGWSLADARVCAGVCAECYGELPPNPLPILPHVIDTEWAHARIVELDNAVIVAFRGTACVADIWSDVRIRRERVPGMGSVHRGFLRAFESVWPYVEKGLTSPLQGVGPGKAIVVTGHSLGAAMAILCARWIQTDAFLGPRLRSVYAFGCPRVGNREWAKGYGEAGSRQDACSTLGQITWRVRNGTDPVCEGPAWLGYRHVPQPVLLEGGQIDLTPHLWQFLRVMVMTGFEDWRGRHLELHHPIRAYIGALAAVEG